MPPTMTRADVDPVALAIELLRGSKETGYKHDVTGALPANGYLHGPGGLLTYPGVDPNVFSTIVGIRPGILGQLPTRASILDSPIFEVLTGIKPSTDPNKEEPCDPAPVGGMMKAGKITAPFGRYEFATRQLELGRVGHFNDRADPMDLRLLGNPLSSPIFGVDQTAPPNVLTREIEHRFMERNVFAHRTLARQVWTGSPLNNSAGGGYKEFAGLATLVRTGYIDVETGGALPSVDSVILENGYQDVENHGSELVQRITTMYRNAKLLAETTGLDPVRFTFAMREPLFYAVTGVWPCAYYIGGCQVTDASGQRVTIDARDQIELRDNMRVGRYLLIDGEMVEVVVDDGIPQLDGNNNGGNFPNGCFSSDIYLLAMSVLGGTSTLYLEYFDFTNADISEILAGQLGARIIADTRTNGAWLDTLDQTRWCLTWQMMVQPRVILRTPWLCARLEHVVYCPLLQPRSAFPDDPYWVNGGAVDRMPGPSLWTPWSA